MPPKITRMTSENSRKDAVHEAAAAGIPSALADLGALVRIPSIAWPAFDQSQVQRSAEAVAALLPVIKAAAKGRTTLIATHSEAVAALADKVVRL